MSDIVFMFKKLLSIFVLSTMMLSTILITPALARSDSTGKNKAVPTLYNNTNAPTAGSLIKGKGNSNVYYLGEDGKRYVFPNSKTYFSWFNDFSQVKEIDVEDLSQYEVGGMVKYKPGALLVKIETDPKVYAVSADGILRWVKDEKIAKTLYGKNWNKLIDDVPSSFFIFYKKGTPIENEDDFNPVVEEEQVPTISHDKGFKSFVKAKVRTRTENMCGRLEGALERLQKRFERAGADITDEADEVLDKCYGIRDEIINQVKDKKVTICHKGETLSVAAPALKGHLRHGDVLGVCGDGDEDSDDNDDQDEDNDDQDDDSGDSDVTVPVLSNVNVATSETSATVTWTTDEAADSKVYYATTTGAISSSMFEMSSTTTTSHIIELTGLTASTTYYYVVASTDESGNIATSTEDMFTTLEEVVVDETAPVISGIIVTPSATSTIVVWDTDEDSDSKVYYALESLTTSGDILSESLSDMLMSHSITLMDLATSTEYFYYVESSDAIGNTATSTEASFTTLAQ